MAKVRVYELAKEFGVESKAVMAKLQEMGEFVRSASSTIEAPVVRRLKEAFSAEALKQGQAKKAPGRPTATPAGADGQNGSRTAPAGQATDGGAHRRRPHQSHRPRQSHHRPPRPGRRVPMGAPRRPPGAGHARRHPAPGAVL